MKIRLIALIIILSLFLVSCSLSEDITPPPGYQSPSPVPTLTQATPTPEATWTMELSSVTSEATTAGTESTTPPTILPATTSAALGNITGRLANGSGSDIPDGQKVTLVGFDQDQSGSYQKTLESESPVNPDGTYSFTGIEFPLNRAFLVITSFGGVEYQSDPVFVKDPTTNYSIPITIYDETNDFNVLTFDQVHLKFDYSSKDIVQVTEVYIVTNPGKQVVVVTSNGTTIPFMPTPVGASNVQFQLSQGSAQLLNATGGFAILPGTDKQYGFVVSFSMPYGRSLKFNQPFSLPVPSLTVFVPQGMRLSGEQLTAAGTQTIQNQSYLMYQSNNMASGSLLSLTISGKPGTPAGFQFNRQTIVWIGIGVIGILLIGLGIYLYLRDRARILKEDNKENEGKMEEDALGEDSDTIMDAMIALDDQYKAGEIAKEAYEKRRFELKERLKGILQPQD